MISNKTFFTSVFVLAVTAAAVAAMAFREMPVVLETNLENLPLTIGDCRGTDDRFPDAVYQELKADKNVYRHYVSNRGNKIDLYIGYYGTAKGGRTGHNPHGCLPGAGWGIVESSKTRLTTSIFPGGVDVNYILAQKDDLFTVLFFWYQSAGTKVISSGVQQNLNKLVGKVFFNRDDGAFVQVSTSADLGTIEQVKERGMSFAGAVIDLLPDYWPVEK
jgi:EpsI family protein